MHMSHRYISKFNCVWSKNTIDFLISVSLSAYVNMEWLQFLKPVAFTLFPAFPSSKTPHISHLASVNIPGKQYVRA